MTVSWDLLTKNGALFSMPLPDMFRRTVGVAGAGVDFGAGVVVVFGVEVVAGLAVVVVVVVDC